jgi:hypothetical protein
VAGLKYIQILNGQGPGSRQVSGGPTAPDSELYLASENNDVIVVKMGRTFEVLATNNLQDQVFVATPNRVPDACGPTKSTLPRGKATVVQEARSGRATRKR